MGLLALRLGTTAAAFGYGGEQKDHETGLVNLRP